MNDTTALGKILTAVESLSERVGLLDDTIRNCLNRKSVVTVKAGDREFGIIVKTVADVYGTTVRSIMGKSKVQHVAQARQMAMAASRQFLGLSFPAIRDLFRLKTHATAMYGVGRVADRRLYDRRAQQQIETCETLIKQRLADHERKNHCPAIIPASHNPA